MTTSQTPQTTTKKVRDIQSGDRINGKRIWDCIPQRRAIFRVVFVDGTSVTLRGTETLEIDR